MCAEFEVVLFKRGLRKGWVGKEVKLILEICNYNCTCFGKNKTLGTILYISFLPYFVIIYKTKESTKLHRG